MNLIKETLKKNSIYYGEQLISDIQSEIAYFEGNKPFLLTSATLHTFLFFGSVEGKVDKNVIEKYSKKSSLYAKKNYNGKPLGENTGVVSIAMMIGHDIDQSAIDFCQSYSSSHFAIREIPIVYNTSNKQYYSFKGFRFVGFLFRSYYDNAVKEAKTIVKESII